MKKLLALVLGLTFLGIGTTAFAEWDVDRFVDISLKKHSISDTFDISLLHQDEDGNYLAKNKSNDDDYDIVIDLSKVLKTYNIAVYEKADIAGYDGNGVAEYFADYSFDKEEHLYKYIITDGNGEYKHLLITDDEHHYTVAYSADDWEKGISKALAVVNESDISEIYDAYSVDWNTKIIYDNNSRRNIRRYSGIYLDTDKGEFVIFYSDGYDSTFSQKFTKAEILKLYSVQEFLDAVAKNYDEAGEVVKVVMVEDENGDSDEVTVVQKPVKSEDEEELKKSEKEETADEPEEEEKPEESEDKDEELKKPEEKEEAEKPKSEEEKDIGKPEKNDIDVMLHGKQLSFIDQKPIIENDRVLVPFRVIFEALEADVTWDGDTKTVTAVKGGSTISITIGENKITKNGEEIEIDVPARIINERTLVPIRVISESFENTVSWDGTNRIVEIK